MNKPISFGDKVIAFNKQLSFDLTIPENFAVLNPFADHVEVIQLMELFYKKFYNDDHKRKFIIGINPGRHGAGTTGIPFTDTKRLNQLCDIPTDIKSTHELSSLFVYDMILAYGGVEAFYADVYINSLFPLALIRKNANGGWVNCNYYDDPILIKLLEEYMISHLKTQVRLGLDTDTAYILGKKNAIFIERINKKERLFKHLVVLPHPRYIQQYKSKNISEFIDLYLKALQS